MKKPILPSERINPEYQNRVIAEMYDALSNTPRDEDYQLALEGAIQTEQRIKAWINNQAKLDAAAPDLAEALNEVYEYNIAPQVSSIMPVLLDISFSRDEKEKLILGLFNNVTLRNKAKAALLKAGYTE